jgi:hypothetical protein
MNVTDEIIGTIGGILRLYKTIELRILGSFLTEHRVSWCGRISGEVLIMGYQLI